MWRVSAIVFAALCAAPRASLAQARPAGTPASRGASRPGGNGTIFVGTYGKAILVVDEATMTVRDSIKVSVGIPAGLILSFDRKHFYVLDPGNEKVEIIDIAGRKALGNFTLSSGNTKVRIGSISVDPKERFAVLLVKTYTRRLDRYEIGKPTLLRYDLEKRAVTARPARAATVQRAPSTSSQPSQPSKRASAAACAFSVMASADRAAHWQSLSQRSVAWSPSRCTVPGPSIVT